jgi:hypothetical protein
MQCLVSQTSGARWCCATGGEVAMARAPDVERMTCAALCSGRRRHNLGERQDTMMEIVFDIAATEQHFAQILDLQQQNLMRALSAEQQVQQGFVFAEHTMALLTLMAAHLPQVIAISQGTVIGYNLAMPVAMKQAMPSLVPMFTEFERCTYHGRPLATYHFMVGGQVCVAKDFRG